MIQGHGAEHDFSKTITKTAYLSGLLIILGSAYSQYLLGGLSPIVGMLLYYTVVHGIASVVQFTDLVTFGITMAATYYFSGGNLLLPAAIHGVYDAVGFLGVTTSPGVGVTLRSLMMLIGLVVGVALFIQRTRPHSPYE